jgi:hypothetical protein
MDARGEATKTESSSSSSEEGEKKETITAKQTCKIVKKIETKTCQ